MRRSIVVSSFLVAGALGKPINRDYYAGEDVNVWNKTVTVYATNIASASIPLVTVSKAVEIAKSVTEAAIVVAATETFKASAVHYPLQQHKWRAYNTTTSATFIASASSVQTHASATQATATANPTVNKLHVFVTDAPWLLEVSFKSVSIPPTPTSATESIPKPVNRSLVQTLEDAQIAESDGSPYSDGVHLLTTINKWRRIYKLRLLRWNHQLELNALKTGTDGAGRNQIHQLNEGTRAQVITPGMIVKYGGNLGGDTPFELSYVAWLCESSTDVELKLDGKDQCKLVQDNLHMGFSGKAHYNILTSKAYTNIGCAFADDPKVGNNTPYQGLWVCDLN